MNFKINWSPDFIEFYKFGTTLTFEPSRIIFKNEFLSPGVVIARWSSNINYQKSRSTLQLPLLKRGSVYRLLIQAQVKPKASILLKICFYNRGGEEIGKEFLSAQGGEFTFREDAYGYSIAIISTGMKELDFSYMLICSP